MLGSGIHGSTYGLSINNSVLEGLYGTAVYLEGSLNTSIDKCYFECNKMGNIVASGHIEILNITNCGLYGSVDDYCNSLVKIGGTAKRVTIDHCFTTYGLICDARSITVGKVNYSWNRSYLSDLGVENLIITDISKFEKGSNCNKSYFGQFTRLQKTITQLISIGTTKLTFDFGEKINSDDIISVQVVDDRIDGFWYYKNNNTVTVNIKSSESMNLIVIVTVLKPYFSITG